jgi:ABC-type multidrug transport system ATPase subunit
VNAVVELRQIHKKLGRGSFLTDVSLRVGQGAFYGLMGPSGAGKTSLLRTMLGLLRPDRGRVEVLGLPARQIYRLRGQVGATLDRAALEPSLSVAQHLKIHALRAGLPLPDTRPLLERLQLLPFERRKAGRLSQGERQRLGLARALLLQPKLLILDEPLVHLDPSTARNALDLLLEQVSERGVTVILSSHHLASLQRSASHVALIHRGRVLFEGAMGDVGHHEKPRYELRVDRRKQALSFLEKQVLVHSVAENGDRLLLTLHEEKPADLNAELHQAGYRVSQLAPLQPSLEEFFQELVERAES